MIDLDRTAPEPEPIHHVSAGQLLVKGREALELSVEDVARELNLGVDTIKALESNDYGVLPGYTFVKGYIRSYAKLLRLDEEKVLDAVILEKKVADIPLAQPGLELTSESRRKGKSVIRILSKLIVFVLVCLLVLFLVVQFSKLDLKSVAEALKLPVEVSEQGSEDGDEITFPVSGNKGEKKDSPIRIEE